MPTTSEEPEVVETTTETAIATVSKSAPVKKTGVLAGIGASVASLLSGI